MADNINEAQVPSIEDQIDTKVAADLDAEVELETADTSFTYTEARA